MAKQLPRSYKSTSITIIEAAERLFGTEGIEGVSLRRIGLEAKAANKSAVNYHFGDRAELLRAIWAYRLPMLEVQRRMMLRQLYERGQEHDPHAIMRVLVMPNYELLDTDGVHRYAAFFRHALRWRQGQLLRNDELTTTPASQEALALLSATATDVPNDLLLSRLRYGCCTFFDMVYDRDRDIAEGRLVAPEQLFLAEGIDMLIAICLRAPPTDA